jgi:hypothetical protein
LRCGSFARVFDLRKTQMILPGIVGVFVGFFTYAAVDGKIGRFGRDVSKVDSLVTYFNPGSATLVSCCYQGWAGTMFTTGEEPLAVTHLGRWMIRGNQRTHILKIIDSRTKVDVPRSSVVLSLAGLSPERFHYVPLTQPVILQPKTSYYLVSSERSVDNQQELFFGHDSVITANIVTILKPVYWKGSEWVEITYPNGSYGPLSFKYISH